MSELCSLRELGIEFIDGDRGSNYPKSNEFMDAGECLFLGAHNITESGFSFERTQFISAEKDAILRKGKIQRGDIVLMTRGTWGAGGAVGNVALYDDKVPFDNIRINSVMLIIRCNDNYSSELLYYLFRSSIIRNQIDKIVTGSVQNQLTAAVVSQLKVPKNPKVSVRLLQAIDQKMLINKKQILLLESMAKTLYDYWFVQFDFPDDNGHPYKTSGGKMEWNETLSREIPVGWEVGQVSDLGEVVAGGTPSTEYPEHFASDGIAWITPKDMSLLDGKYIFHGVTDISEEGLKNSSAKLMPAGSVVYTTRAPIGYVAIAGNDVCTNQGFKSVVPKKEFGTEFVYYTLKSLEVHFKNVGNGSTFSEVSKETFSTVPICIPPRKIISYFMDTVDRLSDMQKKTQLENRKLIALRDFLLPMLMNGQVSM